MVAITGSYGKTTTKAYLFEIAARRPCATVASPASFNNRMGLARAVNEHLAAGTEVFIAEMGTYGRGEIADLCSWIEPTVGVITAIGPVHLERFGSLDKIVASKAEILAARSNGRAERRRSASRVPRRPGRSEVIRCSSRDATADIFIDVDGDGGVYVQRTRVGTLEDEAVFPGNLSCALGAALALGLPMAGIRKRRSLIYREPNTVRRFRFRTLGSPSSTTPITRIRPGLVRLWPRCSGWLPAGAGCW